MSSSASPAVLAWAGGIGGITEAVVVQPLELVKVRYQLNRGTNNGSIFSCARDIIAEGTGGGVSNGNVLRLYRGLLPELCGMFPTRSAMYASNEMAKRILIGNKKGEETAIICGMAGAFAGISEAVVTTPFQLVKVRLQAKEHLGKYNNSFDCVTKVFRQEGLSAFTTGLSATIFRNSIWNGVYFTTIKCIKDVIPVPQESKLASTIHSLVTGFVAGVTATVCNAPLDVAKSRIQAQITVTAHATNNISMQYTSTLQTLILIGRTEGMGALYKGFQPKAIRMGVGGAVAVTAFEAVCEIAGEM